MVEDGKKAVAHIARQQVQMPHGKKRRRAAADAQRQPALRHARGKDHADEDEEIHQRAARVAEDDDDPDGSETHCENCDRYDRGDGCWGTTGEHSV